MEEETVVTKEDLEAALKDLETKEEVPKEEETSEEVEDEAVFEGVDEVKDIEKGKEDSYGL